MRFPEDRDLVQVLKSFGVFSGDYLGHGGEAWVYALGHDRVLRVLHPAFDPAALPRQRALVDELRLVAVPFALPEVLEVGELHGRHYSIERRLEGRSLLRELAFLEGAARKEVIEAHLDAASVLGDLHLDRSRSFGDLLRPDPIVTTTWREYLERRAERNLATAPNEFQRVDPRSLADALPEAESPSFVHLDAFAGNMLTFNGRITAVIDIGWTSLVGDRRLEPLSVVAYLATPTITPSATAHDLDVAMAWLRNAGLIDLFQPARRWLGAFWLSAIDDPSLVPFCRSALLGE